MPGEPIVRGYIGAWIGVWCLDQLGSFLTDHFASHLCSEFFTKMIQPNFAVAIADDLNQRENVIVIDCRGHHIVIKLSVNSRQINVSQHRRSYGIWYTITLKKTTVFKNKRRVYTGRKWVCLMKIW